MIRFFALPWCAVLLSESLDIVPSGPNGCDCQATQIDPAVSSLMQVSTHVRLIAKNRSLVLQPHLKEGVAVALTGAAAAATDAAHSGKLKLELLVRNVFGPKFPVVGVLGLVGTPILVAALIVFFIAKAPPEMNSYGGRGCPCFPWPPYERISRTAIYYDTHHTDQSDGDVPQEVKQEKTYSSRATAPPLCPMHETVPQYMAPAPRPVPKELLEQICVNYESEVAVFEMRGRKLKPQAQQEELSIVRGQQHFLDVLVAEELEGDRKGIVLQTIKHPEVVITQLDTSRAFEASPDGSPPSVTLWNPWDPSEAVHVIVEQSHGTKFTVVPVVNGIRQPPWYNVLIGGLTLNFYNDRNKMDAKMQINPKPGDDACVEYVFTVDAMVDASLIIASGIAILKLRDVWNFRYLGR